MTISPFDKFPEGGAQIALEKEQISSEDYCHSDISPDFGDSPAEWVVLADDKLKVATHEALNAIQNLKPEDRSWDKIVTALSNSSMLDAEPGIEIYNNNSMWFKRENVTTEESVDALIVAQVCPGHLQMNDSLAYDLC